MKTLKCTRFSLLAVSILSLSFALFSNAPMSLAEDGDTYGDIEFKDLEEQKKVPYRVLQKNVLEYFSSLESSLSSGSTNESATLRSLKKNELDYLAALYLHCSLRRGSCPVILDAVLESDIFNSAVASKNSCPNMTGFWKAWIAADMERRLDHGLKVGLIGKATSFKKSGRPAYIKCQKTVAGMIENSGSPSALISSRYASNSRVLKNLKTFNQYLTKVEESVPNLFLLTNTR